MLSGQWKVNLMENSEHIVLWSGGKWYDTNCANSLNNGCWSISYWVVLVGIRDVRIPDSSVVIRGSIANYSGVRRWCKEASNMITSLCKGGWRREGRHYLGILELIKLLHCLHSSIVVSTFFYSMKCLVNEMCRSSRSTILLACELCMAILIAEMTYSSPICPYDTWTLPPIRPAAPTRPPQPPGLSVCHLD